MQLTKTENQFAHEVFGALTTITNTDGDVFFISNEVSEILDYSANKKLLERLEDDEKIALNHSESVALLSGYDINSRGIQLLTESGLYSAILGSKKKEAKEFKRWVINVVLPEIRRTGGFNLIPDFSDPYKAALAWAEQYKQKQLLEEKVKSQKPKVEYYDTLIERGSDISFRDTAKEIGIGEREMIQMLIDKNYIFRDGKNLKPTAKYLKKGWFSLKEWVTEHKSGNQTLVTVLGRQKLLKLKSKLSV